MENLKDVDAGILYARPIGDSITEWEAAVRGPAGSVYEGGVFKLKITFPGHYPYKPPHVRFVTQIYHCNISSSGSICLDLLKKEWSPVITIQKLLISIISLLDDPCADDPLSPQVARLYLRNREEHDANARRWTRMYANPYNEK